MSTNRLSAFGVSFCLIAVLVSGVASAQTQRILLVGDSWTQVMWGDRSFQAALSNSGLSQFEENGNIARGGSTAAQWAQQSWLDDITTELSNNPTIDIVHLSMGGNDLLASPSQYDTMMETIFDDIDTVVNHVLGIRPDIRCAISGYDYILTAGGLHDALQRCGEEAIDRTAGNGRFFFINSHGLAHHTLGYPGEFAAGERPKPGGYPDYIPLMGGDPNFPGHANAFDDDIHYNSTMYLELAKLSIDAFYGGWLTESEGTVALGGPGNVEVGDSLTLTATSTGLTAPLTYAWYKDNVLVASETDESLVVNPVIEADSGNYEVRVSNVYGNIFSDTFSVTVLAEGSLPVSSLIGLVFLVIVLGFLGAYMQRRGKDSADV